IGPSAVTAWEGALKLRGAARVPAEGFESKYLRYGSGQILGPHDLMLAGRPARRGVGVHHGLLRAGAAAGCEFGAVAAPDGMHPLPAQLPTTVRFLQLAPAPGPVRAAPTRPRSSPHPGMPRRSGVPSGGAGSDGQPWPSCRVRNQTPRTGIPGATVGVNRHLD